MGAVRAPGTRPSTGGQDLNPADLMPRLFLSQSTGGVVMIFSVKSLTFLILSNPIF